jgi:hypothetical protein
MCTKWTRAGLLIAMLAAPSAWADTNQKGGADPAAKVLPATASATGTANAFGQNQAQKQKGGADPAAKVLPATASDNGKANAFGQNPKAVADPVTKDGTDPVAKGGADPAAKALPATASDNGKANAFGQQGARSKAAHQAAHAAASQAAHAAAAQAQAQPPAGTARPGASAQTHASTTGVTNGFDRAAAGSTNGQGSTHRH